MAIKNKLKRRTLNKKGGAQLFITKAMVIGVLIFIFAMIFGVGGGFSTTWNLGQFVAKVPVWFWLVLGGLWLFSQMRK